MTMNPLPPQAYTKETLLKAYHWLQQQTPSIREMAMTPDIMVSLYLKASRDGDQALERPSIQNFKTELRNLAGLMGELEGPAGVSNDKPASPSSERTAPSPAPAPTPAAPPVFSAPLGASFAPPPPRTEPPPRMEAPRMEAPRAEPPRNEAAPKSETPGIRLVLDSKSLEMLREVREDFNLSTDSEALRMLIKIGFTKAKTLL